MIRVFSLMRSDLGENWVGPDLSVIRTELGALQMKAR